MRMEVASRTVTLRGPDHTELGVVATSSLGTKVAIALSRGKYLKGYPSLDPNEDGVLASVSGDSVCLAVVDGHDGFDAAAITLQAVINALDELHAVGVSEAARPLTALLLNARDRLRQARDSASRQRSESGCSVIIALLKDDGLVQCSLGDAHAVVARGRRARRVVKPSPHFRWDRDLGAVSISRSRLRQGETVILGTDGVFDFLGSGVRETLRDSASANDASLIVRVLIEKAFAGGAGDNVATAVAVR